MSKWDEKTGNLGFNPQLNEQIEEEKINQNQNLNRLGTMENLKCFKYKKQNFEIQENLFEEENQESIQIEQKLPPVPKCEDQITLNQNHLQKQISIPTEAGHKNYNKHNQIHKELSQVTEQTNDYSESQISRQDTLNRTETFRDDDFQTVMFKIDLPQESTPQISNKQEESEKELMTGDFNIPEQINELTSKYASQKGAQLQNLEQLLKRYIIIKMTENSQSQSQNDLLKIDEIYEGTLLFIHNEIKNLQEPAQQQNEQPQIDLKNEPNNENVVNQELVKFCLTCNKKLEHLEADSQANRIHTQEDHPIIFVSRAHMESDQFKRLIINNNIQEQQINQSQPEAININILQNIAVSDQSSQIEEAKIGKQPYSSDIQEKIKKYTELQEKFERGEDIEFEGKYYAQTAQKYRKIKKQIDDFLNDPK